MGGEVLKMKITIEGTNMKMRGVKERINMMKNERENLGRNPSSRQAIWEERGRRVAAQLLPVAFHHQLQLQLQYHFDQIHLGILLQFSLQFEKPSPAIRSLKMVPKLASEVAHLDGATIRDKVVKVANKKISMAIGRLLTSASTFSCVNCSSKTALMFAASSVPSQENVFDLKLHWLIDFSLENTQVLAF